MTAPAARGNVSVERVKEFDAADLHDLCDAADAAIESGGGFGWLTPPDRHKMEGFWNGITLIPERFLWVGRLDGIMCSAVQLQRAPKNNEAQRYIGKVSTLFTAPWARGYGLSGKLLEAADDGAQKLGMKALHLDIRSTQGAGIAVIEKHGFERIGENPYYAEIDGAWVPGVYFTKKL